MSDEFKENKVVKDLDSLLSQNGSKLIPDPESTLSTPAAAPEIEGFFKVRQGPVTHALETVNTGVDRYTEIDPITGKATFKKGGLTVAIAEFKSVKGWRITTSQLCMFLIACVTKNHAQSNIVTFPLQEYANIRGLKDLKETRRQLSEDLETLQHTSYKFEADHYIDKKYKGKSKSDEAKDYYSTNLIFAQGIVKGIVTVKIAPDFFTLLRNYPVMDYPALIWKINSKHNPYSFNLLAKISELKNMNVGKKCDGLISVKTLLQCCTSLPKYEDLLQSGSSFSRRIKEPFERDMNANASVYQWEYCNPNGTPLSNAQIEISNYETFINLLVKITWPEYPDQTARLERKAKRITTKKRAAKKKTE